jgi:hypothetical protein
LQGLLGAATTYSTIPNSQNPARQHRVLAILFNVQTASQTAELIYLSRLSMPIKNGINYSLSIFVPSSTKKLTIPILHQLHGDSQVFRLKKIISQRKLTESLDLLEKSGVSGDFALFIIQNIQLMEDF